MLPLRCLSFLLLSAVVIYCDEEATETLIEMKGDKLDEQETTGTERVVVDENENDDNELRMLNKDYDRLSKVYVSQYYTLFDVPSKRLSLVSLYHSEDSFLSFEGERCRGTKNILELFERLKLGKITRSINSVDSQPLADGKIVVNVTGKVRSDNEASRLYAQTFIFKPQKGSFFLQHDIFRTFQESKA